MKSFEKENQFSNLAGIWRLVLMALLLIPAVGSKAAIVERHDLPWQIVTYSVTGTTAEPEAGVMDITFEPNGDLWIARHDGLFFFDGYEWKRFGMEHGLPSDVCRAVTVTEAGVLWVGTDRGCGTFDGETFETHGSEQGLAGPSVTRIREDPDGTLWFCCDGWHSDGAGLSSFSGGQWRSYGLQEGLPSVEVRDYFRDSKGQQYAVTAKGITRRMDDRWVSLDIPGFPVDGFPFDLVETAEGELISSVRIAPGVMGVFMTKEGRWQDLGNSAIRSLVTRSGQILSTEMDQERSRMRVMRFQDGQWAPASAWTRNWFSFASKLVEAPDGAIWGVGRGLFFRWENRDPEWTQFTGLPPLKNVDSRDQIWFTGAEGSWVLRGDHFVTAPAVERTPWLQHNGHIWCGHDGALVEISCESMRIERRHPIAVSQLRQILTDGDGSVWVWLVIGERDEVRVFSEGVWNVLPRESHSHGRLRRLEGDTHGVLALVISRTGQARLRRFASDLSAHDISTPTGAPTIEYLWSDQFGIWARGGSGLFHLPQGEDALLSEVERFQDAKIIGRGRSLGQGASYFLVESSPGGANLVSFDGQSWNTITGRKGARFVRAGGSPHIYVSIEEKLYRCSPEHEAPIRFAQPPLGGAVSKIRHRANGDIWFEQDGQTLRYRPRKAKPRPVVRLGATKIMVGDDTFTPVNFSALNRFEPDPDPESFNYSWRIDEGVWSQFSDAPPETLPLAKLPTGDHALQLRVINAAGVMSVSAAEAVFAILPIPLQQRAWFRPTLFALVLSFAALSALLFLLTRRLRTYAGGLEEQVQARTIELRHEHEQLRMLATRSLMTEERERTKLAADLHDSIGQTLALSQMRFSRLHDSLQEDPRQVEASEIMELIAQSVQSVRDLTVEVSPPMLFERELDEVFTWLTEKIQSDYKIPVHFLSDESTKTVSDEVRILLYRSVRELLINAAKHSQAGQVTVQCSVEDETITVNVEDDGAGFDLAAIDTSKDNFNSFGMFSIRERMRYLSGNMKIDTAIGKGTRIELSLPLETGKDGS